MYSPYVSIAAAVSTAAAGLADNRVRRVPCQNTRTRLNPATATTPIRNRLRVSSHVFATKGRSIAAFEIGAREASDMVGSPLIGYLDVHCEEHLSEADRTDVDSRGTHRVGARNHGIEILAHKERALAACDGHMLNA